ncbi:MAG: beta-ketoacyl-ACP synthase [Treponema sp.]|jgi:3-oxoacyl-[acyl-carrier-protein] synthase II|nr:beta-ketoacyl-ACP synthase [Treponema sp.]
MNNKRRVAVTGGGLVSALGSAWPAVLANLKARKNFVRYMTEWDAYKQMNTRLAAPVDCALPEYPRKKIRGMGRVALLALTATEQALSLAGLQDSDELTRGRFGVSFGSSIGAIDPLMDFLEMLAYHDMKKLSATTYLKIMPQTCAANIEVFYGLTGRLVTTNTACTSGSQAIGFAYELIRDGVQDVMIAGGSDELSVIDSAIFDTLFATSTKNDAPHSTPSAYDKHRDGLVVGEGAAALILEDYDHALKRGAVIYAELAGFGTNTDGKHLTTPNQETMAEVMRLALRDARLEPREIGYVNTHGTATAAGDAAESGATYDVFQRAIPASTIKNYIGHTLGACGAIEAWITINMMREKWFAPNINLNEIDPACAPLDYITGEGREIDTEYVMSNNFAFGGINTSLIFRKAA